MFITTVSAGKICLEQACNGVQLVAALSKFGVKGLKDNMQVLLQHA